MSRIPENARDEIARLMQANLQRIRACGPRNNRLAKRPAATQINGYRMPFASEPFSVPQPVIEPGSKSADALAPTYYVICWNDPVNLMSYVTHVFMKLFGWNRQQAEKHMLEVHQQGKSVLVREGAERAEFYVHELQKYKLRATMEPVT